MGRTATGVKGFNVDGSYVIGVATNREGGYILAVSEFGYGKKSILDDYRLTTRGAKGVKTINITPKTGDLVSVRAVDGDEDLMIITNEGIIIRISLENVGVYGTNATKKITSYSIETNGTKEYRTYGFNEKALVCIWNPNKLEGANTPVDNTDNEYRYCYFALN